MNVEYRMKRTLKAMREDNVIDRDKYNEYVQAITCWVEYIQRLEKENEEQKKKISELESELSVKENLNKTENGICEEIELSGLTPIEVAEKLINAESEYETNIIQRAFGAGEKEKYNIFSVSELRQIAEHLLVYCNHNSEGAE